MIRHTRPTRRVDLSILMPVYNEAKNLPRVIPEALRATDGSNYRTELVFLNDASTDESLEILKSFQSQYPEKIRILNHLKNQGIMQSLTSLMNQARGEYFFFNSSDGQFRTSDATRMMAQRRDFDIIVGKRKRKNYNFWRSFVSFGFNCLPKVFFGTNTYDAGSIKLYQRQTALMPLISKSPFREAERLIRAEKMGLRVGSIDVDHLQRKEGTATGADIKLVWQSLLDLCRCFWSIEANPQSPNPSQLLAEIEEIKAASPSKKIPEATSRKP